MTYNDEQWELIRMASPHFESARHEYIRNAPRWLTQQIIDVYEQATGRKIPNRDLGCAVCVLRIYQTIGRTYFEDLEHRKQKEEQNAKTIRENTEKDRKPDSRKRKKDKGSPVDDKDGIPEE